MLTTNASEKSIAGVLTQDGHAVIFLGRILTESEQRYSNTDREALAIVWCMERAKQFLLGTKFILKSDHRPLEFLFNQRRALPKVTSARLIRWDLTHDF